MENGGRVVSAGERKVLFLVSRYDERLAQYDKKYETAHYEGDYSYPRGRVFTDRPISSSSHGTQSHYLWKHDYETKTVTIVSFDNGEFEEHNFSYAPSKYSGVDYCWWIVSTDFFLVFVYDACLRINLALGTIEELPGAYNKFTGVYNIFAFDRTIYENDRYEIIERYLPGRSRQKAAYYVRYREPDKLVLLQSFKSPFLFYQAIEEVN